MINSTPGAQAKGSILNIHTNQQTIIDKIHINLTRDLQKFPNGPTITTLGYPQPDYRKLTNTRVTKDIYTNGESFPTVQNPKTQGGRSGTTGLAGATPRGLTGCKTDARRHLLGHNEAPVSTTAK